MTRIVTLALFLTLSFAGQAAAQSTSCPADAGKKAAFDVAALDLPAGVAQRLETAWAVATAGPEALPCLAGADRQARALTMAADGNLTSILQENWNGTDWENVYLDSFDYDEQNRPVVNTTQMWDGAAWMNESRFLVTYDANDNIAEGIFQEWNGTDWDNLSRQESTWDANGNQLTSLGQSWENGMWVDVGRTAWTIVDNRVMESLSEAWDNGMWVNASRGLYEYDGDGRPTTQTTQIWNDSTEVWEDVLRILTEYGASSTTTTSQFWFDLGGGTGMWQNVSRTTSSFDGDGRPTEDVFESWDFLMNDWQITSRDMFTHDERGLLVETLSQNWDGAGWVNDSSNEDTYDDDGDIIQSLYFVYDEAGMKINDDRLTFNYGEMTTGIDSDGPTAPFVFDLYPTPATDRVHVEVMLEAPAHLAVDVYDLLGRRVARLAEGPAAAGVQRLLWVPGSDLPAGLYLVRLRVDETLQTRTVVRMQ